MTRLSLEGTTIDLDREAAIAWAVGSLVGPLEIVGGLHWMLTFAMPRNSATEFLKLLEKTISPLRENASVVDDNVLAGSINDCLPPLQSFVLAAIDLREWEESHVPRAIKDNHARAVADQGPLDPPWADEAAFHERMRVLSTAFSAYLDTLARTIPRLRSILPPSSEDTASAQLDRAERQIPDIQEMLRLGYPEAIRRKASQIPNTPSA